MARTQAGPEPPTTRTWTCAGCVNHPLAAGGQHKHRSGLDAHPAAQRATFHCCTCCPHVLPTQHARGTVRRTVQRRQRARGCSRTPRVPPAPYSPPHFTFEWWKLVYRDADQPEHFVTQRVRKSTIARASQTSSAAQHGSLLDTPALLQLRTIKVSTTTRVHHNYPTLEYVH